MVKNLVLENISVGFKLPQGVFYAVDDVSLNLPGGNFTAISVKAVAVNLYWGRLF